MTSSSQSQQQQQQQQQQQHVKIFSPSLRNKNAYINSPQMYDKMYQDSVKNPQSFWGDIATNNFYWKEQWPQDKTLQFNFDIKKGPVLVKWFEGGKTNLCYNALDRHVESGKGKQIAFYWEGNDLADNHTSFTYEDILTEVCKFANVLKSHGVKKGDRVTIYLPMVIQLVVTVLACVRIGAIHSVVFAGFSAESLSNRILDSKSNIIITADGVHRGKKPIHLKREVDEACEKSEKEGFKVQKVIVVQRLGEKISWRDGRDMWYHDEMSKVDAKCEVEWVDAEDPSFMLYTSGSTGKPKGLLHTTGGYMVYTATTLKYVFDYKPGDIYWCAADIGWITGHSYIVYGPLLNGATSVMFEGLPTYPDASRVWQIVDKYKVNQFYTAPTLIRSLMGIGDEPVKKCSRDSLRILGSVGEPINPEAWMWYYNVVGNKNCSIVDTYWQTETGGHIITPLPGAIETKPGCATRPFFGIQPVIIDEKGTILEGEAEGFLAIKFPWPGIARTVYADQNRYEQTYFSMFAGYYLTGDGCKRDGDGYYWLTGRIDDVLNISGHRLGTAEIESAFVSHNAVAEAAVVPIEHKIKGQGMYCYVTLIDGKTPSEELKKELIQHVRHEIGAIATPDVIHWAPGLPKTRSGKIMRRILRKIAEGTEDSLGDISTLADKSVVQQLIEKRPKYSF